MPFLVGRGHPQHRQRASLQLGDGGDVERLWDHHASQALWQRWRGRRHVQNGRIHSLTLTCRRARLNVSQHRGSP